MRGNRFVLAVFGEVDSTSGEDRLVECTAIFPLGPTETATGRARRIRRRQAGPVEMGGPGSQASGRLVVAQGRFAGRQGESGDQYVEGR
jgi:hypothetical protein